jgi:hypothetical protein
MQLRHCLCLRPWFLCRLHLHANAAREPQTVAHAEHWLQYSSGAVEQECCTDSIPLDLPSPAEHTVTFPSLKLHGLQAVPINAKEGQVPPTETREGIDGSEMIAGSEIREGPSQRLCHCNSCSTCQSEQPHQMIANAMQSMLVGAGVPAKFWPYAFWHYLRVHNLILSAGQDHSPYEICSAVPEQPNNRQVAKVDDNSQKGIFPGFAGSMKKALDLGTEEVCSCQHLVFDEAMADMLPTELPSNTCVLVATNGSDQHEDITMDSVYDADALAPSPSEAMVEVVFPLSADGVPGFEFADCSCMHHAFVTEILSTMDGMGKGNNQARLSAQQKDTGSYIVEVECEHVVTCNNIAAAGCHCLWH